MPYFDLLEKVGIFHKSPSSAANYLNGIWEHLEEWWQRHEIQEARAKFCDRFSRVNANPIGSIANVLLEAGKNKSEKIAKSNN
jgi:putative transferase (TIGR04331 family)